MKKSLLFFSLLIILTSANAQVQGLDQTYYKSPDLTLTDIDGNSHNLYNLLDQGKFVLIDLMTTWCSPCAANAPYIEEWYNEFGPAGSDEVEMWVVECDDNTTSLADLQQYIVDHGITSPVFEENDYFWSKDEFPYTGFPTYFVICPDHSYKTVSGNLAGIVDAINAAKDSCPDLGIYDNDGKVVAYEGPFGSLCSNPEPVIVFENRGLNELTSITIEVYIEGVLDNQFEWTGSLYQYDVARAVLPELVNSYDFGTHSGQIVLKQPNGVDDQFFEDNTIEFEFTLINGVNPNVHAKFRYGAQNYSFEIYDEDDVMITSHVFSSNSSYGTEDVLLCLESGSCFKFVMKDEINAAGGAGFQDDQEFLEIKYDGEVLLYLDKTNYNVQVAEFEICTPSGVSVEENESEKIIIYPNPVRDIVFVKAENNIQKIYVYDISGRLCLSSEVNSHFMNLDVTDLNPAVYLMKIELEDGVKTAKLVVEK